MKHADRWLSSAILVAGLGGLGAMEVATQTPVVKVLQCMQNNLPKTLSIAEMAVESTGAEVRTPKLSARLQLRRDQGKLQVMLAITAPADLAGTRYLLLENEPEDELYLYVPAMGKVRRISGYGSEAEIGGSALSPAELRVMVQALRGSSINLEEPQTVRGRMTDTLRFVPSVIDSPYRRILVSVDRQTCAVLQAEFHSARDTAKQFQADPASLTRSGNYAYASVGNFEDLQRSTRARVALRGVRTDEKLPARNFDPRSFYKGD